MKTVLAQTGHEDRWLGCSRRSNGNRRRRHTRRHRVIIRRRLGLLAIIRRRLTRRIEPGSLSFPCQCDAGDAPFAAAAGTAGQPL